MTATATTTTTTTTATMSLRPPPRFDPKDPSYYRRKRLTEELGEDESGEQRQGAIIVSSFFPIQRYYEAADKVLGAFEEAYGNLELDNAFVFGKRYCNFVFTQIPTHNYFKSPRFQHLRTKHQRDAETVLGCLEKIKLQMDEEERVNHKKRMEQWKMEQARIEQERKRQEKLMEQREKAKYQELLRRAELQRKTSAPSAPASESNGGNVEQSAMSKLELLMKKSSTTPDSSQVPAPPASSNKRPSTRYALSDTDEDDEHNTQIPPNINGYKIAVGQPLPPPLPPPDRSNSSLSEHSRSNGSLPPPPPYDALASNDSAASTTARHNPFLGRRDAPFSVPAPYAPWGEPRPPSYSALPDPPTKRYPSQQQQQEQHSQYQPQPPAPKRKKKIPVRHFRDKARQQYQALLEQGRIEIRPIDTYQGRYGQSTNGCTVISPLVVAHHLATPSGVVLPDREIKDVIDNECGPLLREIRGKLGLENHSLIIPSDVHDHLVDKHILKQEYFIGATGGNIISEEHIGEFLKLFQEKDKAGAALFFREHVVSIVKIPAGGNGRAFYDLVDSMPGIKDGRNNPCASRTRCKDEEALNVLLAWYATKKFTESNCSYIDNNDWNDNMADLDPRVFQAFVWGKDL